MNQTPSADVRTLPGLFSVILPNTENTLLLRSCFCSPVVAQASWSAWIARVADPKSLFKDEEDGLKGLLPFIGHRLTENGISPDEDFQTYLRMSAVREDLRNRIYRDILHDVLMSLTASGIQVIVLKGAALSETVYPSPALRHNHAIDLFVETGDVSGVTSILPSLGFSNPRPIRPGLSRVELTHHSGLALVIHTAFFDFPYFQLTVQSVREGAVSRILSGVQATILSPEDSFLYVCGQAAAFPSRSNLRWICDCWSILQVHPEFDWEILSAKAAQAHLVWPIHVISAYFADELDMPIPRHFRDSLPAMTDRTTGRDYEPAFVIALTALTPGAVLTRCRAGGWKSLAKYFQFALFPSAAFVRWKHAAKSGPLPLIYIWRLVQHVLGRASRLIPNMPDSTVRS